MLVLFNYNFNPKDVLDLDFNALYERRRRDSCFAFAFKKDGKVYALRDHFGIVPLFFSWKKGELLFSTTLDSLVSSESRLSLKGYKAYIAFGTAKILPLFQDIEIVPPGSVIEINDKEKSVKTIYTYRFKKMALGKLCGMRELVKLCDRLLLQAVKRTLKYDEVGLYFSGVGVDSSITGVYLKRCGAEVNAYTVARWGQEGSEGKYSPMTAERIGVKKHYIDVLNSGKVKESLSKIIDLYKTPHGTSASVGVASLWLHTPLPRERQIYGAQGADTINCAVPVQNVAYVSSFIPRFIRRRINNMLNNDVIDSYIRIRSQGLLNFKDMPPTIVDTIQAVEGKVPKLSIAGMLICHTAGDGEALSMPAINSSILYSNPFYDVDLAEFFLGIPLSKRLNFTFSFKEFLDKVVLRNLAKKYLDPYIMKVKKGFNVPLHTYGIDLGWKDLKPPVDIPTDLESRFAAYIFHKYCELKLRMPGV